MTRVFLLGDARLALLAITAYCSISPEQVLVKQCRQFSSCQPGTNQLTRMDSAAQQIGVRACLCYNARRTWYLSH